MSKKPRFFCDNCGSEVGQNAKSCQHCGRYFASVRCPACGHIGDESSFRNGCPSCGYSAPPGADKLSADKSSADSLSVNKFSFKNSSDSPPSPTGKLPLWVYILSTCAFIGVCTFLLCKFVW